jgi:hypothetical protein
MVFKNSRASPATAARRPVMFRLGIATDSSHGQLEARSLIKLRHPPVHLHADQVMNRFWSCPGPSPCRRRAFR